MKINRILDLSPKIVVDLFAGGGGVSEGIEMALGYPPHVAVNHNPDALSMHRINHPFTRHLVADVFEVDPRGIVLTQGRPVGALHLSPDCTHHSQARGGQPRDRKIRALTWVAARWAGQVRPDVITLENVKQILQWGPLVAKRDPSTGRVIKIDRTIAKPGERVPLQDQFLIPDQRKTGRTWRNFVRTLSHMGYEVEVKKLVAADYGAATSRERLFMIARCDGLPIMWPEVTHHKSPKTGELRWRPAADCIDWSIPCASIFGRKKDLAPATLRRIARGIDRYVLNAAAQFIVPIAHYNGSDSIQPSSEPLRTIVASTKGGEFAVAAPVLAKFRGQSVGHTVEDPLPTITSGGDSQRPAGAAHALGVVAPVMVQAAHGEGKPDGVKRWGLGAKKAEDPLSTITANGGGQALAAATLVPTGSGGPGAANEVGAAYLMQCNGGFCTTPGHEVDKPMSTITNTGSQQQLVTAYLARQFGCSVGQSVDEPAPTTVSTGQGKTQLSAANLVLLRNHCDALPADGPLATLSAGGEHHAVVEYTLSEAQEAGALRVAAFLIKYYGEGGQWGDLKAPIDTITTKDRLALVTVRIKGTPYVIVDIGLRMLTPRELYRAQGFRNDYIISHGHDGRKFPVYKQVRMVGNSVPPDVIEAIYRANLVDLSIRKVA